MPIKTIQTPHIKAPIQKTPVEGFLPIEDRHARILILGSMPGAASLAARQYYAHPQNTFWRILSLLLMFDRNAPYAIKIAAMKSAQIAVWDVLKSCIRSGSADAMIERDTQMPNDFSTFFRKHRGITHVFFNGTAAEIFFRRHALRETAAPSIRYGSLPSTSPANASLSFEEKLQAWRIILSPAQYMGTPSTTQRNPLAAQ